MVVELQDVESLDSTNWDSLPDADKQDMLEDARTEADTMYSGRNARLPTVDGDRDIFVKNLTAHKWELAEGGEAQSESQTGGSTSYQSGTVEDYLSLTRYGQTAMRHLRDEQSIAIVRTWH